MNSSHTASGNVWSGYSVRDQSRISYQFHGSAVAYTDNGTARANLRNAPKTLAKYTVRHYTRSPVESSHRMRGTSGKKDGVFKMIRLLAVRNVIFVYTYSFQRRGLQITTISS